MISLKSMHTSSFTPSNHALFNTRGLLSSNKTPILLLSMCKARDNNSTNSDSSSDEQPPPPEGDSRQQERLARIAMLQTQKVRLTDYLDEKSTYLTRFAEDANAEFDKVAEDALKDLDDATTRIMGTIETQMQEFEESTEMNKAEIEDKDKKLIEFEGQIEDGRNEGLFFKNLRENKPINKPTAMEEMEKIKKLTIDSAGSKTRRNIYLALIGLLVIGIADSFISSSPWPKAAVLGAILVGLISQLIYEQSIASETDATEKQNGKDQKE